MWWVHDIIQLWEVCAPPDTYEGRIEEDANSQLSRNPIQHFPNHDQEGRIRCWALSSFINEFNKNNETKIRYVHDDHSCWSEFETIPKQ
jgi:hypothetical protein